MTDKTLMRPMTITLELSEPEPGVYVAQAVSDDGDHALVESTESPYEGYSQDTPETANSPAARGRVGL